LHPLRDALFAEDHSQPIALTALAGMEDIGKTVLAKAFTDDEVVGGLSRLHRLVSRRTDQDPVWLSSHQGRAARQSTAGKERKRDFIEEMPEVAKALGDDLSATEERLVRARTQGKAAAQKRAQHLARERAKRSRP
jgi:hypothetical protein